jgi:hypothetical protein
MNSLAEVRRVRMEMSKSSGHDIRRLIAKINENRSKVTGRIISPGSAAETVGSPTPGSATSRKG